MAKPKETDSLQKKNESTVTIILGIHWKHIGDILGLYRDNGKENGNHYLGFRVYYTQQAASGAYIARSCF